MAKEYDSQNIFAKILNGEEKCFKVYESRSCLAFLDAFPWCEGHTVVVPKLKGHTDMLSMPPAKAAELLSDVQKVARAVKQATGATGINILQNNGEEAGQTVFHPHFHVVPRHAGDDLLKLPASGAKISEEAGKATQATITEALNPKKPLKKARFHKVSGIKPDSAGLNLKVEVVEDAKVIESKAGKFWEMRCGDASGTVVVSLRENQKDVAKKGAVIALRNAAIKMVGGHIRVAVDKWGKVEASDEGLEGAVEMADGKNVSETEYKRVEAK